MRGNRRSLAARSERDRFGSQSVLILAGARHVFKNVGTRILRVRAALAAAIFEASYDDRAELSRRYLPPPSPDRPSRLVGHIST